MSWSPAASTWAEQSFLAEPGRVADWRMVLLYDLAAEAGILSRLPATGSALAADLELDEHGVVVVLEALQVWGVVRTTEAGVFTLGPAAPPTDGAAVVRHHARAIRHWSASLDDRIRRAEPIRQELDDRNVSLMLEALTVNGRESAPDTVDACLRRVPGARRALDLGGGHGEYAIEFARRGVKAIMQDRPGVVDDARRRGRLEEAGVELFAGDLFETLPAGSFDLVFCAGVSYTYSEGRNLEIFRKVKPVLSSGGSLAVHTFLRGEDLSAVFAVQMLAGTGGGDTHGEDDYRRWLSRAGYRSIDVQRLARRPESLVFASP